MPTTTTTSRRSKKPQATHSISWNLLHSHYEQHQISNDSSTLGTERERKEILQSKLEDLSAFVKSIITVLPASEYSTETETPPSSL